MRKYLLPLVLMSFPVWGANNFGDVNISQTLNMTSSSALISGTGATATISMTNGYFKNISGTLTGVTVGGNSISSDSLVRAKVVFNALVSPATILRSFNVTGVTTLVAGRYVLAGTFPDTPVVNCMASLATAGLTSAGVATIGSPTTTSITIVSYNTATAALEARANIMCTID